MGSEFTFYDYFDADRSGIKVIKNWLNGDGKRAKPFFTVLIGQLEASPPAGGRDSLWKFPYTKLLTNEWGGFVELRKEAGNVQYRILGQIRDRDVFLVACGVHKEPNYVIDVTPRTALNRIFQMADNPTKYRRQHGCD